MALCVFVSGCASEHRDDFADVREWAHTRSGAWVQWDRGTADDARAAAAVDSLLKQELTAEQAVQVGLLCNRHLQATFEDIGIAQADLVQAGLLKNPVFDALVRFPDRAPRVTDVSFSVAVDFLDLFFLPARKNLAAAQLEAAKLRVTDEVLKLAAEIRSAYYALQAQQQILTSQRSIAEAASVAEQFAQRQHDAGNLSDLDLANQQALAQQAHLDELRIGAELAVRRERLGRLMGTGSARAWSIAAQLPPLPQLDPRADELEAQAMRQRLDLLSAQQEVAVAQRQLGLARGMRLSRFDVGGNFEHDPDGSHLNIGGPTFSAPLPLFDQGQGLIGRASAQFFQAQRRLEAATADARSEVRQATDQLAAARAVALEYRDQIVPLRQRILEQTQLHYNGMLAGVYELLQARRDEAAARREYVEALRDYWVARSELERAIGGRFPGALSAPAQP